MKVSELQARQGNVNIELEVVSKEEPREFEKFGKSGKVCNAVAKDDSGQIKLTLWNEQVDQVNPGAKVRIENGYVNEWQGELQLTTGKFGKLEVLEAGQASEPTPAEPVSSEQSSLDKKDDTSVDPDVEEDII